MVLTHYCVFDVTDTLLVMHPYQICATERILNRILVSETDPKRSGPRPPAGLSGIPRAAASASA